MNSSNLKRTAGWFCTAAFGGQREEVAAFLAEGWAPNTVADGTDCPLACAARGGHLEIVKDLLAAGADVNGSIPAGDTPLMSAVGTNNLEIAELLIEKGADVNRINAKGYTALRFGRNNPRCVALLNQYGLFAQTRTLSKEEREEFASAEKLDLRQRIDTEDDPVGLAILLDEALVLDFPDLMIRAIERGADVPLNDLEREEADIWSTAAWAAWHGHMEVLRAVVNAGADVNAPVEKESVWGPPLLFAVEAGHFEAVKNLVEAGANVNETGLSISLNLQGTALLLAGALGRQEIYDYLLPLTDKKLVREAEEFLRTRREGGTADSR